MNNETKIGSSRFSEQKIAKCDVASFTVSDLKNYVLNAAAPTYYQPRLRQRSKKEAFLMHLNTVLIHTSFKIK